MKKVLILIIVIVILIILIVGWLAWTGYQLKRERAEATILTYKTEYPEGENPKIKITNNSDKRICFSSCYPYYLERDNGDLKSYKYDSCPEIDVAQICLEPGQVKAFELLLENMGLEKGHHRVAIPACIGCALQEKFRQDKFFYSNEFIIE